MKLFIVMLIVFSIGFSTNSNAVDVIANRTCGVWAKDHAASSWEAAQDDSWLYGYLSGYAMESRVDFLHSTDADSIILWMNNYCNTNPLDYISVGVIKLKKELIGRMH